MMRPFLSLILLAAFAGAAPAAPVPKDGAPLPAAARDEAPQDGWAGQAGGTRGGAGAAPANVLTVTTPAQLRAALASKNPAPRIVAVKGTLDMSEGRPYLDNADQARRGRVALRSNTTLVGLGPDAGFVNAHLTVSKVSQVIIRNLNLRNPCDVAPRWDPQDGRDGNWNAQFDSISIVASSHVWVDHNSFTDAPDLDDRQPVVNGKRKQCHDGALDIREGADFVTVSYNRFALHQKNMLIGASDKAGGDSGRLRVTLSNNLFEHIASRAPRVRFGQVHLFNNYHVGDRKHPVYRHEYAVGVATQARIVSQANVFELTGARSCTDAVRSFEAEGADPRDAGVFTDSGSLLNGAPLGACGAAGSPAWTVPYPFAPRPAGAVPAYVLANAGAGKLAARPIAAGCPTADFLVCDGFADAANWHTQAGSTATLAVERQGVLRVRGAGRLLAVATHRQLAGLGHDKAFVEARVRLEHAAGAQQFYLLGRYIDERNWVGAGVEQLPGSDTVQIALVRMADGVLTTLKRVPRARLPDDRFAMLRLEMASGLLAVYLDGERITTAPQPPLNEGQARLGLLGTGGGIALTHLRAGVPGVQPARIAPALASQVLVAQAGDPAQFVAISAVGSDGATRLPFRAVSSNPAVLDVAPGQGGIEVTPKAPGSASIVVTGVADSALQTTIAARVGAAFRAPEAASPPARALLPAPRATAVPVDTLLRIRFDAVPKLAAAGSVRILRADDDALVDIVRLGEEVRAIGYPGQPRSRYVRTTPVTVEGDTVLIRPHAGRLAYGTDYYVLVDGDAFGGATIGGKSFAGVAKGGWTFRTLAAPPAGHVLSVDDDGPAHFRTVQGALNHAMEAISKAAPVTIDVRNGRYDELLFILGKDRLTLRGESRDGVVIQALNNDGLNPGSGASQGAGSPSFSGGRAVLAVEEADLLAIENLTLRNTTLRGNARSGQAETVYFNNDSGRLVAKNASFHSEQDTIQVKGYAWFYRTLVEGNVDFIWGANRAALFEDSELRSVGDSANAQSGGYLVQARTVSAHDPGFVFLNSVLTHGPGPKGNGVPSGATWLARSPGTASTWDNVAFVHCRMGEHIAPGGWAGAGVNREPAPNPAMASAMQGWREHGSMDLAGKPLDLSRRVGGYLMTAEEAQARFGSRAKIFAGFGGGAGWDPQP